MISEVTMPSFVYVDYYRCGPLSRKIALKCIRNKIPHSVYVDQHIPRQMFENKEDVIVIHKNSTWGKGTECPEPPIALICFDELWTDDERHDFIQNLLSVDFY